MAKFIKKDLTFEESKLIYKKGNISVEKTKDGLLFNLNSQVINDSYIETTDYLTATAMAMRVNNLESDRKFWNIKLINKYENINLEKTLYWLSGGKNEWNINKVYKHKWEDVKDIFLYKYSDKLLEIIKKSRTLGDLKRGFKRFLNLQEIYEFSLTNNLI